MDQPGTDACCAKAKLILTLSRADCKSFFARFCPFVARFSTFAALQLQLPCCVKVLFIPIANPHASHAAKRA